MAGTGADVAGIGTIAWANPGDVTTEGNPYATATNVPINGGATHYLQGTDYGFAIPDGAIINGITVVIGRYSTGLSSPYLRDNVVRLIKGGTVVGTNKAATTTDWPTTLQTATYGGTSDNWGTTWTAAEINAANFGVALSAINNQTQAGRTRNGYVDYMQISVTYTPLTATTTTVSSSLNPSARGDSVTFTATVTRSGAWDTPTGTVDFQDGGVSIGTGTLSGSGGTATATLATSSLTAGSHSITAIYSGDATFASSRSSILDLTVKAAAGLSSALITWIFLAAVVVGLFFLLVIYRRRRKHPSGPTAISSDIEVSEVIVGDAGKNSSDADPVVAHPTSSGSLAAEDAFASLTALATVEDMGTYSIQLERELERSINKVERSMHATIQALSHTVETKDPYVAGHQKRVSQLACTIAKEMGLTARQIEGIRVAGLIHDIGKIAVPSEILSKPGRLSDSEFSVIKDHPKVAFDILKNIEFDWPIAQIVVEHHERLDGSGYPYGIQAKDILLEARILAVADVVEAMSSHRPYRPALGVDAALAELARGDGTLYDSDVVRALRKVIRKRGVKKELSRSPA